MILLNYNLYMAARSKKKKKKKKKKTDWKYHVGDLNLFIYSP